MLTLVALLVAVAGSPPKAAPAPPVKSAIAIVINGNELPIDPPPRIEKGLLFVPVRRTLDALGLPFDRSGNRITTQVGSKSIVLAVGSRFATVDGQRVELDAPTVEIASTLYAPLRFFTDALGAQARFDRRAKTVTIVAQLIGRSDTGLASTGSGYTRVGTVSAVDVLSDPPTLTFGYDSGPKTVPIAPNASIDIEDVNANVTMPGELGDVRPGDFARVEMRKDGRVERVVDAFGSRTGRIVAVAGNQFVLDSGQVVTAGRTTEVSLNGKGVGFVDLRPGDVATVRYNVETNEVRQVLAGRTGLSSAGADAGGLTVSADVRGWLRTGDVVHVTLQGPPGGSATFGIGSYVTNVAMHDTGGGSYSGSYQIPRGVNFDQAPIVGQLTQANGSIAEAVAPQTISASSIPPGIVDFAPDNGAVVNDDRPAVYATFGSDGLAVSPSTETMTINGRDVTGDAVRTPQFIQYVPAFAFPDGTIRVTVRVADGAGNTTSKSWTFTIKTH
ncbi:MAG TPA: stalk domain-containing protein [Candidatus Tumulicola sp.]